MSNKILPSVATLKGFETAEEFNVDETKLV